MGLFSKSHTVEMKDVAVTKVWKLQRCIFLYCVTPSEIIILILFQVILGKEGWVIFGRDNQIKCHKYKETMVRVLELSSIIGKEKVSSENYLNSNKELANSRKY